MKSYKQFLKEAKLDYQGSHTPPDPDPDSSAPLHNLTNLYPEDVYSHNAHKLYGDGLPYDQHAFLIAQSYRNKPNKKIIIYRAVPKILSNQDKINQLEQHKKYILKYGKLPKDVTSHTNKNDYYGWASAELDKLKSIPTQPTEEKPKINPGDWVTLTPQYAHQHGESNLNNNYKVLRKTVLAKHLFTHADSIHEWGYHPY